MRSTECCLFVNHGIVTVYNDITVPFFWVSVSELQLKANFVLHPDAEKINHFSFMNKSFNTQCNLTRFSTLIVTEYYHRCYFFNFWNLY